MSWCKQKLHIPNQVDYSNNKGTFLIFIFLYWTIFKRLLKFHDIMSRVTLEKEQTAIAPREVRHYKPGIGLIPCLTISWWNHSRAKVISAVLGENSMHISFSVNLWMSNKPTTPGSPPELYTGVTTSASARFLDNSITLKMTDNWRNMVKWMVVSINVYTGDRHAFW